LGGVRGIGVDIKPEKVELMSEAGYDCIQGDVTKLDLPSNSVRFVVMSHFLEHLPDLVTVKGVIGSAARIASDFLFIRGPYFDADEFLKGQGLKFYWSDWHGHPCHLSTSQLRKILLDLGLKDYVMMGCGKITDSSDPVIHALDSPIDQRTYDPEVHPGKPFISFRPPLYKEIVCCIRLRPFDGWENVLRARKGCERLDAGVIQRKPVERRRLRPISDPMQQSLETSPASERLPESVQVETRSAVEHAGESEASMPLPRFLIIGAQKSATRWLRANLGAHPEIFTAGRELSFFNKSRFNQGLQLYLKDFEGWNGEPIVGEATPGYMMWNDHPTKTASRIQETLPRVRLTAILRNPVDRTYSAFIHHVRRGRIPANADLLKWVRSVDPEHDKQGLITGGWYATSLAPYVEIFGERLKVFLHDEAVNDPRWLYDRVLEHVGASADFLPASIEQVRFSNERFQADQYTDSEGKRRSLTSSERIELYAYFHEDLKRLEELLGRDLSIWKPG
jgi:hypothetical protein